MYKNCISFRDIPASEVEICTNILTSYLKSIGKECRTSKKHEIDDSSDINNYALYIYFYSEEVIDLVTLNVVINLLDSYRDSFCFLQAEDTIYRIILYEELQSMTTSDDISKVRSVGIKLLKCTLQDSINNNTIIEDRIFYINQLNFIEGEDFT